MTDPSNVHAMPSPAPLATTSSVSLAPRPLAIKSESPRGSSPQQDVGPIDHLDHNSEKPNPRNAAIAGVPKPPIQPHLLQQPRTKFNGSAEPIPIICTSKKWVLPPRPKPGRKPSQDTPAVKRKAQNRAAQKAYRERRAAAAAAEGAAVPAGESGKKKKGKKPIKDEEGVIIKEEEEEEEEEQVSLTAVDLNEPFLGIKIKQEDLFNMASCIGPRAMEESEHSRFSYSPEIKEEEGKPEDSRESSLLVQELRALLLAANQENERLNLLVSDLRTEVAVLKDLKVAEKAFLYDEPQFSKSGSSRRDTNSNETSGTRCFMCESEADCACMKLGLKANPFFGGQEELKSSVLAEVDVDMFLAGNDEDWMSMRPQDPVPLPKRTPNSAGKSTLPINFKRLQESPETDYTTAFLRRESPASASSETGSAPRSMASSWTGSSGRSPGSAGSTPMTSEDERMAELGLASTRASVPGKNDKTNNKRNDFDDFPHTNNNSSTSTSSKSKGKRLLSGPTGTWQIPKKVCSSAGSTASNNDHENDDDDNKESNLGRARVKKSGGGERRLVVDPCGFCSDGTPCLCIEAAAKQAEQGGFS